MSRSPCRHGFNTDVTQTVQAHAQEPSVTTVGRNVVLVAGHDHEQSLVHLAVFRSTDGARSFGTATVLPLQPPLDGSGDPCIRSCGKRVLLVGAAAQSPGERSDIIAYRSCDAGLSFQGPISVREGSDVLGNDKPYLALRCGLAVVSYTEFDLTNDTRRIVTQRSTDGGLTWSAPVPLCAPGLVHGSCVSFGARVYVSWIDFVRRQFLLATSRDGGLSYDAPTVVADLDPVLQPAQPFQFRAQSFSRLASSGKAVYACWMALLNNRSRVFFSRSRDAGKSWSRPRIIDGDDGPGSQNLFPVIAVTQRGEPHVAFYSNRSDFARLEVLMVRPLSPPRKVSRTQFNPNGTDSADFLGSYIDLALRDGKAFTVWTSVPTQFEQIVISVSRT